MILSLKTERALSSNIELRRLLENVSDSYFDFVLGVMLSFVDDEENQKKMIDFLKENPDSNADEVSEYENKLIFGY